MAKKGTPVDERVYLVPNDGDYNDLVLVSGKAMAKANAHDPYILGILRDLVPGQSAYPGGGAAADFFITRVDGITSATKNRKYNPLVVKSAYGRMEFSGEGHEKAAREFAKLVGSRVEQGLGVLLVSVGGGVAGVGDKSERLGPKIERFLEKFGVAGVPETMQSGYSREFLGAKRTEIAKAFVKALGKGHYPISVGTDVTYVDLEQWPSHKPFPKAVDKVFKQYSVVVHD